MKTILVATDFSAAASNAADYAAEMALAINADLFLLHVYQVPVIYLEVPVAMNEAEITAGSKEKLLKLKDELTKKTQGKLHVETGINTGNFFGELEAVCEKIKPYAVIMGSQGSTAAERLFFGGHAVHAMKHLMWPLITVSPGTKFSAIKKIALACDFDNVVDSVPVDEIKTLVNDFHAALHILNTGKTEIFEPDVVFESVVLKEKLKALKPYHHFIANKDTDEGIIDFAEKNNIDLLIVLPKRHDLFDKLIHKSHTKQLVLHSHIPVMALHQ